MIMKRKLITQMCHEWRTNMWMMMELFIVGVVLWVVFSLFATIIKMYQPPKGIDFNDVCFASIGYVPEDAFKPYPDSLHNIWTDIETLSDKIKENPYVESVGIGYNAIPYNFNFYGHMIHAVVADTVQIGHGNMRVMSPGMVRTLRLTGLNGESSDSLAQLLREGNVLLSTYDESDFNITPEKWIGQRIWFDNDSTYTYRVATMINGIRRHDFEHVYGPVIIYNVYRWGWPYEFAVRAKEGMQQQFLESLTADDFEFGNVYISNMTTVDAQRDNAHHDIYVMIRNLLACALFVMVAVFLGFLGSFWYRTQQRVPEIALRKVNGATNYQIFRRFLGEGMILLLIAILPVTAVVAWILNLNDPELFGFGAWLSDLWWWMLPVTFAVLALMIIAGIWFPARKAMKINPAEALKDQ